MEIVKTINFCYIHRKMDLERTVLYLLPAYVPAYERDTYPISGTFLNVQ